MAPSQSDLSATLSKAQIVVCTTPACPYCKRAKAALADAGYAYAELDVSQSEAIRSAVQHTSGSKTVPQVFVSGSSLGGCDALLTALREPAPAGPPPAGSAAAGAEGSSKFAALVAAAGSRPALPDQLLQLVQEEAAQRSAAGPGQGVPGRSPALQQAAAALAATPGDGGIGRQPAMVRGRSVPCFQGSDFLAWLVSSPAAALLVQQHGVQQAASLLLAANIISPAADSLPELLEASAQQATTQTDTTTSLNSAATTGTGTALSEAGGKALPKVLPATSYHLVSEAGRPGKGAALNSHYWWSGPVRPAVEVAADLRARILALYDTHLSSNGRSVNYPALKADPRFAEYVDATAELQRVDLAPLSREELMVLFINLYNAAIIHATVVLGAPTSALQRAAFFTRDTAYCIGGHTYSADDMENGVLRGNRAAASNPWVVLGLHRFSRGHLKASDPRAAKVVQPMDPRIHFALVCGAKSCPPIKLYTPGNLEEALGAAGEAFCASEVEVDPAAARCQLSMIFKWYSVDFGDNERQRLAFIARFLQGKARSDLEALLAGSRLIKVTYKPYDWALND
ncbi:glutaredoxin-like protein [Haematococcus lacustris]